MVDIDNNLSDPLEDNERSEGYEDVQEKKFQEDPAEQRGWADFSAAKINLICRMVTHQERDNKEFALIIARAGSLEEAIKKSFLKSFF